MAEAAEVRTPVVEAGTAGADTQRFTSTLELWAVGNGRPFSCAEHVQQLGGESPLPILMEEKG